MAIFQKHFTIMALMLLMALRFAYLFMIQPGNAPDEVGHLLMVVGLGSGRYIPLSESMALAHYPYSIYNPLGYLPSAGLLGLVGFFNSEILTISNPFLFSPLQDFLARLGMQFWTFGFCFFLLKSIEDLPLIQKASLVLCLALVPQLVFVQSYVNLDSLGLAVFAYLLWSVKTRKERHLAFGVFLLSCCKMNFFCLLVIPLAYLLWNFRQQKKVLFRKMILLIALPFSALFVWLFFSYWVNTRPYGSFLGFDVLVQLYPSPPSRFRVFTLDFVNMSLASAFGRFGWMNLRMPEFLYFFWRCLILPAGIVFLWRNLKKGTDSQARFVAITCLMIIVLNLITHTWFSFNNEYQPQGRYLFPTVLILLSYLVMGLLREPVSAARKRWCVALCFFMMISSLGGIFIAAKTTNKPKGLATTWNSPQKNSTEY